MQESATGIIDLPDDDVLLEEAMIKFMYEFELREFSKDEPDALLFLANLFALADKYDISSLKKIIAKTFVDMAIELHFADYEVQFSSAIELIYTTTPSSVRELRDAAVGLAQTHLYILLKSEEFEDVMDRTGEFGKDLTKRIHAEPWRGFRIAGMVKFVCEEDDHACGLNWMMDIYKDGDGWWYEQCASSPLIESFKCPRCHSQPHTLKYWDSRPEFADNT